MIFWYLLPIISAFLLIIDFLTISNNRNSNVSYFIALICLLIFSFPLILSGEMGLDFQGYKYFYDNIPTFFEFLEGDKLLPLNLEPGYQYLVMIAKSFNLGDRGPVFLLHILSCFCLLKGCKVAQLPPITVSALFLLLVYPDFYGQQRMAFAYSVGILIIGFLKINKPLSILLMTIFAASFQYVAMAYVAVLFIYFIDKVNYEKNYLISKRLIVTYNKFRKIFSRDFVSYFFLLVIAISILLIISSTNIAIMLLLIDLLEAGFGTQLPFVDKFLQYYYRNQEVDLSFLGSLASTLFVIMLFLSYSSSSAYIKMRYGILFLILSILFFALLSPLPFLSYRVVQLFYLPGLIYVGSIIISKNKDLYVPSFIFIFLLSIRYVSVVSSLGPYSF